MTRALNKRYQAQYDRNLDPGEIERHMVRAGPESRIAAIEDVQRQMENPDLSIRERSELLSLKARMQNVHLQMQRVFR